MKAESASRHSDAEAVVEYYRLQAKDYHNKYYTGNSQSDMAVKPEIELLQNTFRGLDVLEIACGTGFWTEIVAESANSILATDANPSMIAEAEKRLFHLSNVSFSDADAYSLSDVTGKFTGAFAVLFWCHIPRQRIREFLIALHDKLAPGSSVVFIDQLEDSDVKTHQRDKHGNMIAGRKAAGKEFCVVKNIPEKQQLLDDLHEFADDIHYKIHSSGYWSVSWKTGKL
ncbi:MAG: class I SAM-dependent methyltransferase [Candidatus Sabulitectum sp.]|nr:class I SAM-dependent methyltransferase [Candidatus Sabulitectum sp.]